MELELIGRIRRAERLAADDTDRIANLVRLIDELRRSGRDTQAAEQVLELVSASRQLQLAVTQFGHDRPLVQRRRQGWSPAPVHSTRREPQSAARCSAP